MESGNKSGNGLMFRVLRAVAILHGALELLFVVGIGCMLLFGTVSDLGKSAALLFMVISWSGVPLLVFAFHNKEILKVELLLGIAYAIVALVPICIYAIWLISEGVRLNLKESALALGPTIISLILFIIILALARIAVNEKKY